MAETAAFNLAGKRVFVAGHRGMVGAACVRRLAGEAVEIVTASRDDVDQRRQQDVGDFMAAEKPDVVIVEGVMAFTDVGIETLPDIIETYKASPDLLKRSTDLE